VAGATQQLVHLARPVFLLDFDEDLEFSRVVGITQGVKYAARHPIVRSKVIMHDDAARHNHLSRGAFFHSRVVTLFESGSCKVEPRRNHCGWSEHWIFKTWEIFCDGTTFESQRPGRQRKGRHVTRRPIAVSFAGYSSVGCFAAEPASASPDNSDGIRSNRLRQAVIRSHYRFARVVERSGREEIAVLRRD
jgi:hypothetical protein